MISLKKRWEHSDNSIHTSNAHEKSTKKTRNHVFHYERCRRWLEERTLNYLCRGKRMETDTQRIGNSNCHNVQKANLINSRNLKGKRNCPIKVSEFNLSTGMGPLFLLAVTTKKQNANPIQR